MKTILQTPVQKSKAIYICLTALLLSSLSLFAQVQTAQYVSMIPNSKAYFEYLPEGYDSSTQNYPLIICTHGTGGLGNGSPTSLAKVTNSGVSRQIRNGVFPKSFTVNGQTFKFIVISPQFVQWPNPADMDGVINYVVSHYRVDVSRIYLTGLSMGGGVTWAYTGDNSTYAKRVAAIVPVCGANWPDYTRARIISNANVAVWATHNNGDPTVPVAYTTDYVKNINIAPTPNPIAKKTIFSNTTHDAWTKTYDPAYKENGMNMYEWMLQYKRGGAAPPPPAPTPANIAPKANAGADITITLPVNTVLLNGSGTDSDGLVTSYSWSKISGPSQYTFNSMTVAGPTVTNLTAGSYIFRLTVKDNNGASAYDDVTIGVNAAPNQAPKVYAGNDTTITLPDSSVTLNGLATDTDGTIVSYQWNTVNGPSPVAFGSATGNQTMVSGLRQGTYTFSLQATDNAGATSADTLVVTVNPANVTVSSSPPPADTTSQTKFVKVNVYGGTNPYNNSEWNNWNVGTSEKTNISTGTLNYSDGTSSAINAVLSHSQNVGDNGSNYSGGMAPAEVLRYTSYSSQARTLTISGLSASKKYNIELYASRYSVGNSTLFTVTGAYDTVNVYDNYNRKSCFTNLTPDAQGTIVINFKPGANYSHFNGFMLTEQGSNNTAVPQSNTKQGLSATDREGAQIGFSIIPNPVKDQFALQVKNGPAGRGKVSIVDMNGVVKKEFSFVKAGTTPAQLYLSAGELPSGTYIISITIGNWKSSQKFIKQ